MKLRNVANIFIVAALVLFATQASAAISDEGLLNDVTNQFLVRSATWGASITTHATWLFWSLVTISLVWTFGTLALKKADISDFFAEFMKFTVTTGFFWWLLANGSAIAMAIINSLRQVGAQAAGVSNAISPSTPVSIAFDIVKKAFSGLSWIHPIDNLGIVIISVCVVVCMAIVAANFLIALVTGWVLAYAGIFILGFGGSRWTSEMAIGYFKGMLAIGLELMTMILLLGIATSVIDGFYQQLDGSSVYELLLVFCVCAVLALLIHKIPARVAALSGGGNGSGAGVGVGSIAAAASVAAAAAATAGAAIAATATSAAGGASALMEAFKAAQAAEGAGGGGDQTSLMSAVGNGQMSGVDAGSNGSSSGGNQSAAPLAAAMGEPPAGVTSIGSGGGSGGGMAGKAARVAAGTVSNLARGGLDVAANKFNSVKDSALQAISQTTGGQIATAIRDRAADTSNNYISAANENLTEVNAEEEKAAFVNQGSNAGDSANERTA